MGELTKTVILSTPGMVLIHCLTSSAIWKAERSRSFLSTSFMPTVPMFGPASWPTAMLNPSSSRPSKPKTYSASGTFFSQYSIISLTTLSVSSRRVPSGRWKVMETSPVSGSGVSSVPTNLNPKTVMAIKSRARAITFLRLERLHSSTSRYLFSMAEKNFSVHLWRNSLPGFP